MRAHAGAVDCVYTHALLCVRVVVAAALRGWWGAHTHAGSAAGVVRPLVFWLLPA